MKCYYPRQAWLWKNQKNENGKSVVTFDDPFGNPSDEREGILLPCGQCLGCRLEKSRQWATRCAHEEIGRAHV